MGVVKQAGPGPGPYRTKEANDEWIPTNENNRMTKKKGMLLPAHFCPSPTFERLSQRDTSAFKSLRDNSSRKERMAGDYQVNGKPPFCNYASTSADETASSFSSSISECSNDRTKSTLDDGKGQQGTFETSHVPSVQSRGSQDMCNGQYLSKQETTAFKMHKNSIQQRKDIYNSPPLKTQRPSRSRESSPFHNRLAERNTKSLLLRRSQDRVEEKAVVTEEPELYGVPNDPSPLHERLANQETYSTASKRSNKPPSKPTKRPYYAFVRSDSTHISKLTNASPFHSRTRTPSPAFSRGPSPTHERLAEQHTLSSARKLTPIRARAPSPRPFYTLVTKGSFTGRDDVSEITMRQPTPTKQRSNSNRSNPDQHITIKQPKPYSRRALPLPTSSPPGRSRAVPKSKLQQKKQEMHLKQDALYRRLASLDTIASSRMKPIPLKKRMLCPYEKTKMAQAERIKSPSRRTEVYTRLISRGNKAAMKKQMFTTRYGEDHDTFAESRKHSLLRKFEGSTFVRV